MTSIEANVSSRVLAGAVGDDMGQIAKGITISNELFLHNQGLSGVLAQKHEKCDPSTE